MPASPSSSAPQSERLRRWATRSVGALTVAAVAFTLLVGAFGPAGLRDALAHGGIACPFQRATGVDCAFCGTTRSTLSLGAGELVAALEAHPLGPLVVLATLAGGVLLLTGRPLRLGGRPLGALPFLAALAFVWAVKLWVHV